MRRERRKREDAPARQTGDDGVVRSRNYVVETFGRCIKEELVDWPAACRTRCGCDNCLREEGLALVYHAEDIAMPAKLRRFKIVSVSIAELCPELRFERSRALNE